MWLCATTYQNIHSQRQYFKITGDCKMNPNLSQPYLQYNLHGPMYHYSIRSIDQNSGAFTPQPPKQTFNPSEFIRLGMMVPWVKVNDWQFYFSQNICIDKMSQHKRLTHSFSTLQLFLNWRIPFYVSPVQLAKLLLC